MKKFILLLFLHLFFTPLSLHAAEINLETNILQANDNIFIEINLELPKGAYTYAPTYSAYPTKFVLNNFLESAPILYYQDVKERHDTLTNTFLPLYEGKIKYFIKLKKNDVEKLNDKLSLSISFLLCTDKNCTPFKEIIDLNYIKNIETLPNINSNTLLNLDKSYKNLNLDYNIDNKSNMISDANLFSFTPKIYNYSVEATNYSMALLLGFIAGLILNFMPCVLPVITIKFASILQAINKDSKQRDEEIKLYSLYYSFGIITLFLILAVLVGFFDLLWGQLFQNIYFIILLTGLIFMFALSLLGLFYFPLFNINVKAKNYPRLESFLQGLLATIIATPCSGPLLGGVLAFSLTLPLHLLITVFISTGIGMAFPYILVYFFPKLVAKIPRTGKWTIVLEKILGYIFIITCIYLLSLLPEAMLYKAIIYLFFVYFFISIYAMVSEKKNHIFYAIIIFIIHSLCSYTLLNYSDKNDTILWEEFSYNEFASSIGQYNLLVNFTANWCPTCKIIEKTSLKDENIKVLLEEYNLKLIKVDMTEDNKIQSQLLRSLNSNSIPLIAIFPKGENSFSPIILRDVFTYNQLQKVLKDNL